MVNKKALMLGVAIALSFSFSETVTLQEGVDGYSGVKDTELITGAVEKSLGKEAIHLHRC